MQTKKEFADPAGGEAALRWLYPDRYPESLRPGAREVLELEVADDRGVQP
jgi:hypothetical protein